MLANLFFVLAVAATSVAASAKIDISNVPRFARESGYHKSTYFGPDEGDSVFAEIYSVSSTDETATFGNTGVYCLYDVWYDVTSSSGQWSFDTIRFVRLNPSNVASYYLSMPIYSPISFCYFSPASSVFYVFERTTYGIFQNLYDGDKLTYVSASFIDSTTDYLMSQYTTSVAGPYPVVFDVPSLFDYVSMYLNPYMNWEQQGWSNGYDEGRRVGDSEGYERGYDVGYQEALDDTSGGGIVGGLFGAIMSVPISVLNGTMPFVIWDVPVISIIFTFLVVALLLWIIKRFV